MKSRAAILLAAGSMIGAAACADLWGFHSVTENNDASLDAGDATSPETGGGNGDGGCMGCDAEPPACDSTSCLADAPWEDASDAGNTGEDGQTSCEDRSCDDACVGRGCRGANGDCDAGLTLCGGQCVDTTSSPGNCGGCADAGGQACPAGPNGDPACTHSACTLTCDPGFTFCGGACIKLNTTSNCGGCGVRCDGGTTACSQVDGGYTCTVGCLAGDTLCNEACVSEQSDPNNCGSCAHVCTTDAGNALPTCSGSNCNFTCNTGFSLCSGACVNEQTDNTHCGGCNTVCDAGSPLCANGTCTLSCGSSAPDICNGTCVDKQSDPNNCGACGVMCAAPVPNSTPVCNSGICTFQCNAGYTACNGTCVNEQTDRNNCGGCGSANACTTGVNCVGGHCKCAASACPGCPVLESACCANTTTCGCAALLGSCN